MEAPVRVCCGTRHAGPVCPNGCTMCCLCFNIVPREALHVDTDGETWDYCKACAAAEERG